MDFQEMLNSSLMKVNWLWAAFEISTPTASFCCSVIKNVMTALAINAAYRSI
jgi:hypothetical protein